MRVEREQILRFRAWAGGLAERCSTSDLAGAARGGLQDTAPRSALLSLHARADGVTPHSWADERLAQVWGPRLAVYLVPRADYGVFTVGRLPRDPTHRRRLERVASAVQRELADGPRRVSALFPAVEDLPGHRVRAACATGRYLLRWDARVNVVVPVDRPDIDPEQARLELARRYLHWLGPSTWDGFARWAGVEENDARQTWRGLGAELVPVRYGSVERYALAADGPRLADPPPVRAVRLLPPNDPYLARDRNLLVADAAEYDALYRPRGEAAGAIFVDGDMVGVWARQQNRVTLRPWRPLPVDVDELVRAAAHDLAGPMGKSIDLRTAGRHP